MMYAAHFVDHQMPPQRMILSSVMYARKGKNIMLVMSSNSLTISSSMGLMKQFSSKMLWVAVGS